MFPHICLPYVIPAILFVIPVKTGIRIIRQLCCGVDIQNILIRFSETSFAGFHKFSKDAF